MLLASDRLAVRLNSDALCAVQAIRAPGDLNRRDAAAAKGVVEKANRSEARHDGLLDVLEVLIAAADDLSVGCQREIVESILDAEGPFGDAVALADAPRFPPRALWAIAGAFAQGSPLLLVLRALLRALRQETRWAIGALRARASRG